MNTIHRRRARLAAACCAALAALVVAAVESRWATSGDMVDAIEQLAIEALTRRQGLKILYTSGYTENAIVHHGRLDPGVLLLPKPYLSSDLARMIRTALAT